MTQQTAADGQSAKAEDYRKTFYARYAETHLGPREGEMTPARLRLHSGLMRKLYRHVMPPDRTAKIIDVGCGIGAIVFWLQSDGYENASGVDVDENQIEAGRALGIRNLSAGDLRAALSQASAVDAIILRDVLEHFTKAEILDLLELCRNALREGGRLIIQVPNGDSPFSGRMRYGDFTHEITFTATSLSQLLAVTGFRSREFHPVPPVMVSKPLPVRMLRALAWKMVQFLYKSLIAVETGKQRVIVSMNILTVAYK
jgi:2-polyprenyl-3-methyl-5-hydroxy-6-metoxy-1,4-benzoquinol methylase